MQRGASLTRRAGSPASTPQVKEEGKQCENSPSSGFLSPREGGGGGGGRRVEGGRWGCGGGGQVGVRWGGSSGCKLLRAAAGKKASSSIFGADRRGERTGLEAISYSYSSSRDSNWCVK